MALVALQVWSLATPQIHAAARRYLGASVWRLAFFVWGTLFGLAAIIGIVRINLNCQAVPPSLLPDPAWASAISFILLAPTFTTRDPRPALRAFLERLIAQWISWNWRARMVLLAFCLNILPLVYSVGTYWKRASQQYYLHNPAMPVWQLADGTCSNLDHFCQQCRAQIPPNANILYHGPNDGLVMAYELYPRRLYMLPYEQRNLCEYCWCLEKWCRGMAPDPLDIVWKWDPPIPDVPEDQFVREHHITYVVNYDYFNPANTSILPLQ
ncbi:MAG TPA: hypothetical protein VMJ32_03595 [Pirellulales bacterium]|nr:hypothetical protein [Pirellulales bacterium]